jgi:hypothetical protein
VFGLGLTDPYLKLDWAKRHLEALDDDLEVFHHSDSCRLTYEDDPENMRHILRVQLVDVPDHISLRCGDVEENLLWRLNAMCNLDKHRRIPANGSEVFFCYLPPTLSWCLSKFSRLLSSVAIRSVCNKQILLLQKPLLWCTRAHYSAVIEAHSR